MNKDQWFYSSDGENHVGPVTRDEIISLLDSKALTQDSLVWNPELDEWKPIREVSDIEWEPPIIPPPLPSKNVEVVPVSKPETKSDMEHSRDEQDIEEEAYCEDRKESETDTQGVDAGKEPAESCSPPDLPGSEFNKEYTEKGLSIRWFMFYVYVRIPLGIFLGVLSEIMFFPGTYQYDPAMYVFGLIFTVFDVCMSTFLLVGLHRRRLWGWKLNWVCLVLDVLVFPFRAENGIQYVILLIFAVVWLWLNGIYFKKRKCLFS
ncbi:MAG TPA: GYF domain-containing protein [bacterium]|nr:GYF domain-containing protein [bacterium]HQQ00451.1 GYF domain-containing protein [bacterium]